MDFLLIPIMFTPLAGALIITLLPGNNKKLARIVALVASLIPLAMTIILWLGFDTAIANADAYYG